MHNERPKNTIAKLQTKFRQNMFLSARKVTVFAHGAVVLFMQKRKQKASEKKSLVATGE